MNILRARNFNKITMNLFRMAKNKRRRGKARAKPFLMPKKGSEERLELQYAKIEQKKEIEKKLKDQRMTPPFLTAILLG